MTKLREFINDNSLLFTEGNRNTTMVTLIGYSLYLNLTKSQLESELINEIEADDEIQKQINDLWNYCKNRNYGKFWIKDEAKKNISFNKLDKLVKGFLVKNKKPIIFWGDLPDNTFFEGSIPEGYKLAINPSGNYIVVDVDFNEETNKNGFLNISFEILSELEQTLNYSTKNKGKHYWLLYTGNKPLANKTSGLHIDLRTNKGYVVWYSDKDIRDCLNEIKETSTNLNTWLENLFSYI